jgi:hypothetical protein
MAYQTAMAEHSVFWLGKDIDPDIDSSRRVGIGDFFALEQFVHRNRALLTDAHSAHNMPKVSSVNIKCRNKYGGHQNTISPP